MYQKNSISGAEAQHFFSALGIFYIMDLKKLGIGKREIKFRAQRISTKEWIYATLDEILNDSRILQLFRKSNNETQYTGQSDKNGKEIYEGDIVKATEEEEFGGGIIVAPISWHHESGWCVFDNYENAGRAHGLDIAWGGWKSVEVIGNVFENPELLK